ncbi:MAG TPA: hypothetical protein PKW26_00315 [Treponemataceae bacterium]|nr:hypothetical protein [Treponemataceae bacterium]HOQ92040.1 hypothetical protein [Treponemataceae bacterium]
MIAVIIAESEDYIKELSQKLDDEGLKIIRYTWLLKALDNLEEINPQRIYVNALDYPRHWKTLVQYSNGNFLEKKPEIFLYQIDNFGEEEREKAKCLDVKLIADVKSLRKIEQSLVMINPHTKKLILGTVSLLKNKSIVFNCEQNESVLCLKPSDLIQKAVLKKNKAISEPVLKISSISQKTLHLEML